MRHPNPILQNHIFLQMVGFHIAGHIGKSFLDVYQVEWRVGVAKWVSEWEHFLLISVLYGMNQDLHSNFSMHRQGSFSKQNTNYGVHNSEDIER